MNDETGGWVGGWEEGTLPKPPQPAACSGKACPVLLSFMHPSRWMISTKRVGRSPTGRVKTFFLGGWVGGLGGGE